MLLLLLACNDYSLNSDDKLLPGIDVQVFPRDQLDAAKLWIWEG